MIVTYCCFCCKKLKQTTRCKLLKLRNELQVNSIFFSSSPESLKWHVSFDQKDHKFYLPAYAITHKALNMQDLPPNPRPREKQNDRFSPK
jgi:hypothetical protein